MHQKKCSSCNIALLDKALFCHKCGTKIHIEVIFCSICNTNNPSGASFCCHCGNNLEDIKEEEPVFEAKKDSGFDFNKINNAKNNIKAQFFKALENRLKEEGDPKLYSKYVDLFYKSGFYRQFEHTAIMLVNESEKIKAQEPSNPQQKIDEYLDKYFQGLLDYYIIIHAKELNDVELPEAILRYDGAAKETVDLRQMIFDYLDLGNEKETVYDNFISMPQKKLRNAVKSFVHADPKETLFLLFDQTLFGSCDEGFSFTNKGIYWKAHFNKAQHVLYSDISEVKREKDWMSINGKYFHANVALNIKVLKLLKKIRSLQ